MTIDSIVSGAFHNVQEKYKQATDYVKGKYHSIGKSCKDNWKDLKLHKTGLIALGAFRGLETLIHESLHAVPLALSGNPVAGIELNSFYYPYLSFLKHLTFGFVETVPMMPGVGGATAFEKGAGLIPHLGRIVGAGLPTAVYTAAGLYLIYNGIKKLMDKSKKKQTARGLIEAFAGGWCIRSTFNYMNSAMNTISAGNDFQYMGGEILSLLGLSSIMPACVPGYVGVAAVYLSGAYMAKKCIQWAKDGTFKRWGKKVSDYYHSACDRIKLMFAVPQKSYQRRAA